MASLSTTFDHLPRPLRYIAAFVLVVIGALYFIDNRYGRLEIETHHFYDDANQKAWAHGGFPKTPTDNPITAFQNALENGAPGIELDIVYDPETKHFLVTGMAPQPENETLRLQTVLSKLGEKTHYWLSFKNLADLDFADAAKAAQFITAMVTKYSSRPLVMVESTSAAYLGLFKNRGIHTTLLTSFDPKSSWLMHQFETLKLKYLLGKNGITAASFAPEQFDPVLANQLPHTDIYLLTTNQLAKVREFAASSNVKIILTDKDFYRLDDL